MASMDSLTNGEIRTKLTELGCPVGPVTATTRKVLLKKLKLLLDQSHSSSKSTLDYDPHCSITQLSSGEESDEGSVKSRRKSMPPPKSTKSPRKKSPSRPAPLANSTFSDTSPKAPSPIETILGTSRTSMGIQARRSTRHSVGTNELPSYRSQLKSDYGNDDTSDIITRTTQGLRGLDSNSSISNPRLSTSPFNFGLRSRTGDEVDDGLRSRTSQPINSFTPQPSTSTYKPNQPYSSEFARRLSSLTSTRTTVTSPSLTSKLLDVKESDDEDNGTVPAYAKFSHSVKGIQNMQTRSNGRGVFSQESWFSYDSPISAVLVVILLLFFVMIGFTYVNMHSVDTHISSETHLKYPLCSVLRSAPIPGENCIDDNDIQVVTIMFRNVHKELYEAALNGQCQGEREPLSQRNIVELIVDKEKSLGVWDIEKNIGNLKMLINYNPEWKMVYDGRGITLSNPPQTFYCYFYKRFITAANWLMKLSVLVVALYGCYRCGKWWMWSRARYNEDVYKLVSNILEIVSAKAQESNGFVPISHVRDQLIPPKERKRMSKLWDDAISILESDSRLRSEVQQVEGEEFAVWRWLASPLNSKRKVWQGQAFETVEGSVNSLRDSPTAYLKIRHMFDATLEEGDDWTVTVADAILEKCGDAKILHIVVDKQSREGCVYMKCASQRDAGIAFRALHGSWFDSKLVTVKYIREKRYLERFPDSAKSNETLHPSNNMRNSLQN